MLWKPGLVLQDQQALLPAGRGAIQGEALRKGIHGTEKEAGREDPAKDPLITYARVIREIGSSGTVRSSRHALRALLQSQAR